MLITFIFTFLYSSPIGLSGIGMSVVILLRDLAFSLQARPAGESLEHEGVEVVRLNSNQVFVSANCIKDTLLTELFTKEWPEERAPQAVVIDFVDVKRADLSGLVAMYDAMVETKEGGVAFIPANVAADVRRVLDRSASLTTRWTI
jgi:MFS superfamily sulfate permease-like transporter